jgi:hypothetical protein
MKSTIALAVAVVLIFAGEWIYRGFLRPIDPLTPDVLALAEHFRMNGIDVHPYPVRHGFRHSVVSAVAALQIKGFTLPVSIDVCPDGAVAATHWAAVRASPSSVSPLQNGRLVMYLSQWGDDTTDMARKVETAFVSFHDPR